MGVYVATRNFTHQRAPHLRGWDVTEGDIFEIEDADLAEWQTEVDNGSIAESTLYRAGGTDVAVADGGTGASTALAARSKLGVNQGATAAVRDRLDASVGPLVAVCLGDSTSAGEYNAGTWFPIWVNSVAALYPAWTVHYANWSDSLQAYGPPRLLQTGTAGLAYATFGSSQSLTLADSADVSLANCDAMWRARVRKTALNPGTKASLVSQYGLAGNRSYRLYIATNGDFKLGYTADGSSYVELTLLTAAEMATEFVAGTDIWIGATFARNNGSNAVGQAIKSTDGNTWTTCGTAKTATSIGSLYDSSFTVMVGTESTVDPWDGRIYWVECYKGTDPTTAPLAYRFDASWWIHGGSSTTITDAHGRSWSISGSVTFTANAPLLAVFNGSVGGTTISYADDGTRRPKLLAPPADLVVLNFGHNEAVYGAPAALSTLGDNVASAQGGAAIVVCKQNPQATTASNYRRQNNTQLDFGQVAARRNWTVIDAFAYFRTVGADALVNVDGVHPTVAGYQAWRDEALRTFGLA